MFVIIFLWGYIWEVKFFYDHLSSEASIQNSAYREREIK
jgi:hypothetical protein